MKKKVRTEVLKDIVAKKYVIEEIREYLIRRKKDETKSL